MKHYKFIATLMLSLSLMFPIYGNCKGVGESKETTFGSFRKEIIEKETTLSKILEKSILAMNYWGFINEEILCVVTLHKIKVEDEMLPERRLVFYKKTGDKFVKKFEYLTMDWFLSMYPLRDAEGNMLVIWSGGTAYHFIIFSLIDNEIKIVLEDGSKKLPEIVDIDNDGLSEILISTESWKIDKKGERILVPDTTRIYKWNGKSYKLIKTVPWKNRLNFLEKK